MRVAFVVNNYPPRVGGVENHVAALAKELAAAGHEVFVHTLTQGPTGTTTEHGVVVTRWRELFQVGGLLGFPTPAAARGMAAMLARQAPDVVSVHTRFFPLTWLGAAVGKRRGIPVLHTEHGSDHVASDSRIIALGSRLVDWTLGRWSLRTADRVVGVSSEVVAFVERLSGVRAEVFHNAIEAPSARTVGSRPHLVFVGRMVPGKGWEDFLTVVAAQPPTVTAELLGDGPDLDALRLAVQDRGLAARVTVRGRVSLEAVYEALAGAILVNPTRLSEGFQTTLIEALAVGARVVTYPVPGADVLAAEGAPVTVVARDADAMARAVREVLVAQTSAWSADRVARWTWPHRAAEFAELAGGVAQRRQSRS